MAFSLVYAIAHHLVDVVASGKFFEHNFKKAEICEISKAMNVINDPRLVNPQRLPDWELAKQDMLPICSQLEKANESHKN